MKLALSDADYYSTTGGLPRGLGRSALIAAAVMLAPWAALYLIVSVPFGILLLVLLPLLVLGWLLSAVFFFAWLALSMAAVLTGVLALCTARDGSRGHALVGILLALASWALTLGIARPLMPPLFPFWDW